TGASSPYAPLVGRWIERWSSSERWPRSGWTSTPSRTTPWPWPTPRTGGGGRPSPPCRTCPSWDTRATLSATLQRSAPAARPESATARCPSSERCGRTRGWSPTKRPSPRRSSPAATPAGGSGAWSSCPRCR
ncbi:unnamed protein product, partial [Ectocarpus fasciculatus]